MRAASYVRFLFNKGDSQGDLVEVPTNDLMDADIIKYKDRLFRFYCIGRDLAVVYREIETIREVKYDTSDTDFTYKLDLLHGLPSAEDRVTERVGAKALANLRELLGHVEDGSDTIVRIFQDDATRQFIVSMGREGANAQGYYHGASVSEVLNSAAIGERVKRD